MFSCLVFLLTKLGGLGGVEVYQFINSIECLGFGSSPDLCVRVYRSADGGCSAVWDVWEQYSSAEIPRVDTSIT